MARYEVLNDFLSREAPASWGNRVQSCFRSRYGPGHRGKGQGVAPPMWPVHLR